MCKQHDGCLDAFAGEHLRVITGSAGKFGQLPQSGVGGPSGRKVASDPSFKPRLGIGHGSILRQDRESTGYTRDDLGSLATREREPSR